MADQLDNSYRYSSWLSTRNRTWSFEQNVVGDDADAADPEVEERCPEVLVDGAGVLEPEDADVPGHDWGVKQE